MKRKLPNKRLMTRLDDQRGAVAVTVALTMVVMLGMAALALDVGHALVARNQLQNASDAAALAGARALGVIYEGMGSVSLTGYTLTGGQVSTIASAASVAGADNQAAGVTITVNAGDISVGTWDSSTRTFTPTTVLPRAVRVITRRDGSANGPISTFLANVIGVSSVNVTAVATAQLNPAGSMAPGDMDAPFGIAQLFFTQYTCGDTIQFAPNVPGNAQTCAGWQSFDISPASANNMKGIVEGMTDGSYTPPSAQAGLTTLNFTNGNMASVWADLVTLWQTKTQNGPWNAQVPVYAGSDCSPSGAQTIIGFATVQITYVGKPGDALNAANCSGTNPSTGCMSGKVVCNVFQGNGGSGGGAFGTFGTIPGLVE